MDNTTRFLPNRPFDIICLGRLAVDFYAQQVGARLEDTSTFAKYLGGSSANTAFGCARLGLATAMASRVGDDAMGRFLTETLAREGCDVSHISRDPARLTAAVVLGIEDAETFPLMFYRENCADMAVTDADVAEDFIAQAKALLVTGTHFSTQHVHAVSTAACERARRNGVRTILDIDYRPVLWGLTDRGDGATRYIADDSVTQHLQAILPAFDLVIGTIDEFTIAGGHADIIASLHAVRALTTATLVVKRGALGCAVIDGAVPATLDAAFNGAGVTVDVLNVLGAGDAFNAGFLSGWLLGESYDACCRHANACGALVVSRHGCAPAMPTRIELDYFLANAADIPRPDRDATLTRLHRVTAPYVRHDPLYAFAFDHRPQFFELARAVGADEARIPVLKRLLVDAVAHVEMQQGLQGHIGVLIDDRYGTDALHAATGRGWWVGRPVELPGSNPLEFDRGRSIGTTLDTWPREQVVKCLVAYHPDDSPIHRLAQETQLIALHDACQASGHALLLEVIPPPRRTQAPDTLLRALKRLYNIGVIPEWWKLAGMSASQWQAIDALIAERDPYCRGVLVLGQNATADALATQFSATRDVAQVRGFAVGRTLFEAPTRAWLAGESDDATLVAQAAAGFAAMIARWRSARGG